MPRRPVDSDEDLEFGFDETEFDIGLAEDEQIDMDEMSDIETGISIDDTNLGDGVLIFNGRKYAAGLTWLTVEEEAESNVVYKRSKSIKADFFCTRSFVSQNGFGYLSKGHRMGMASAAAMAADVLVGEWHAVFAAENGWFYVAVHADTVAPDGDRFFESEEDAYNFFLEKAETYKWPKTYVPDAWDIKNNDGEISLDRILDDVASTSLKPANLDAIFSGKRNKSIAFVGFIFFIGLVLLSFFAQTLLPNLVPEQRNVSGPTVEVADFLSAPPQEPIKKEDPLLLALEKFFLPKPEAVVDACVNAFEDLMISLPGWNLSTMRCRNTLVEAVWTQESGTLETIKNYVDQFPFGVNRTYGAQGDFLASRILGNLSQYNERVKLADREQVLLAINNRFGKIGRLEVKDIVPLAQQIQRGNSVRGSRRLAAQNKDDEDSSEEEGMTIQDLPSLAVVFTTTSAPVLLQGYFNIPGLRFNYIEWSVFNKQWVYDMQIYLLPQDAPSRRRL
jgi:hypothetical protein